MWSEASGQDSLLYDLKFLLCKSINLFKALGFLLK